jgi:hypothetical protein
MNPLILVTRIIRLAADLVEGKAAAADTARRLLDAALDTGLPETVLASYLTEAARQRQEVAFEVSKRAKLAKKGK